MNTRPSTLYAIKPALTALYFDRAVDLFGRSLEAAARDAAEGKKKQKDAERAAERVLRRWLSSADAPGERGAGAGGFADPFADPRFGLTPPAVPSA